MSTRHQENDIRRQASETQEEEVTGSAAHPSMVEETRLDEDTEGRSGQMVNSARRREIVEHSLNNLPWGVGPERRLRALKLARQAVIDCGPTANELLVMKAANEAAEEVAIEHMRRERNEKWVSAAVWFLPFGATDDDQVEAKKAASAVLDNLPIDTPGYELEGRVRESLKVLIKEVKRRQRKKALLTSGLSHVDGVLRGLFQDDLISVDERWDSALRRHLEAAVLRQLEDELAGDESDDELQAIVESVVEDELGIEQTSGNENDDYGELE